MYGKDPSQLNSIQPIYGGTSQQRMYHSQHQERPSLGGKTPHWVDNYSPPEAGNPDLIRLLPGSYQNARIARDGTLYYETSEWLECRTHFHGGMKRSSVCSAGPYAFIKAKADPCLACDIFWEDFNERKRIQEQTGQKVKSPNRMSLTDKYVFNVLVEALFYKTEQLNEQGQIVVNQATGKAYYDWVQVTNPNDPAMYNKEQQLGRVMPWAIGKNHFMSLNGYADAIGQSCANCKNQYCIEWLVWQCGNPQCGAPVIRKETNQYNPQGLAEITGKPQQCQSCKQLSYLSEVVRCAHCDSGARANIYDVDLHVKKQVASDSNQTVLQVLGWSQPGPVHQQFAAAAAKTIDLVKRFAPDSLEDQAKTFNLTIAPQNPQQHVQQYGGQPQVPPQQQYPQAQQPVYAPQPVLPGYPGYAGPHGPGQPGQ